MSLLFNSLVRPGSRMLAVALFAFMGLSTTADPASAQAWSLTKEQRKAYLNYYAPVILKRGDENNSKEGRDWLTNYDFDQDGNFSNNRLNWRNINQYVAASASGSGSYSHWRIRPTLYSSLIEYMEGGSKSLVLLYHVYNAADKDASEIHDWERVEIVVHGITGTPGGSGELVNHATVTLHKEHHIRRYYDADLNFMQTATGRHVMLWQADESNFEAYDFKEPHGHELHFVKNTYSWVASQASSYTTSAEVNISSKDSKKNVHYVFVPEGSSSAVSTWGARPLNYSTASSLASRVDNGNTVKWYQVKRLTYELQDLADIIPTHWQYNSWSTHWLSSDLVDILLESSVLNETGQLEVSAGMQRFYTQSRDIGSSSLTDGREGIPSKDWFFGAYSAEINPEYPSGSDDFKGYEGLGTDSYGLTRGAASGYYNSHNAYWWQHDFFVHSGAIVDDDTREAGRWLTGTWYAAENGGFDGRWVQLFDDRLGLEPFAPLALSLSGNSYPQAYTYETWYAAATNGTGPYSYSWYRDGYFVGTGNTYSDYVDTAFQLQVTVTDAAGAAVTSSLWVSPNYGGNCVPSSRPPYEVCQEL
ncbi:MAG TPA: hypothetical protein VKK31_01740 [Thermoanaerobaculia bacterium]|nr:hypothetical protein [Thermoanaerobaculia bacterium]